MIDELLLLVLYLVAAIVVAGVELRGQVARTGGLSIGDGTRAVLRAVSVILLALLLHFGAWRKLGPAAIDDDRARSLLCLLAAYAVVASATALARAAGRRWRASTRCSCSRTRARRGRRGLA